MPVYLTPGIPDVTLSGPVAVAVDALRTLIANVSYFQTWTGTADAAHALARVFTGEVGYPIASIAIAGGVLTVKTRDPHLMNVGDVVTIEGASVGDQAIDIAGPQTIAAVSPNSFTAATALPALAAVNPDHAFAMPCLRPYAVVCEEADPLHSEVVGTGGASIYSGAIEIILVADVSSQYVSDPRNALYEARNAYGQFIQGLATTQGTADLMCLNRIEPVSGPEFISKSEQNNNASRFERWRALVRVTWGMTG